MTKYIHTIFGKPAYFDGYQIVEAEHYGKANSSCDSLKQIRKEQKMSTVNLMRDRLETPVFEVPVFGYDHLRYE